jgi:hypothetical protein
MEIVKEASIREVYFQMFKTSEGFDAVDTVSKEIIGSAPLRKELITKIISRFKKESTADNEFKVYFITSENKFITSRVFKTRKYSRFKVIKKSAARTAD